MKKITILLADDHKIVRDGLCALLEREADFTVVAAVQDGRTALEKVTALAPSVAILDIGMPDLNGIEAARRIKAARPQTLVIGLSMHADRRFIAEMLRAGASGYLLKDCAFEELNRAIRAVVGGGTWLSPRIAGTVIEDYINQLAAGAPAPAGTLSDREREVLQLIAEGMTTKQIALKLGVSTKTIETHRQNIMNKLDLHSVAELTKYAIREGITEINS